MRVFLLGAGASKAYDASPSGERMPIARDFFSTFLQLAASQNPWVLLSGVQAYLEEAHGVTDLYGYLQSGVDIEDLHSEIEAARDGGRAEDVQLNALIAGSAYNQLVFLFAATINEIQNGPPSDAHLRLAERILADDAVITFNWDTLLDRALAQTSGWRPDWGYGVSPERVFRDGWTTPETRPSDAPQVDLIKLHGSTNWLTAHTVRDPKSGRIVLTHDLDPASFNVFVEAGAPYACFAGRYMAGYEPYSYGYYPPNLDFPGRAADPEHAFVQIRPKHPWRPEGTADDSGLVSMPLIIPPVRHKAYDMFGDLFGRLWRRAEDVLAEAETITVIGYSFPKTDVQSDRLFKAAFCRRSTLPLIQIIDPAPDRIIDKFRFDLGIPLENIEVHAAKFTAELASAL